MSASTSGTSSVPFDAARLDRLMEDAGIDVLVATSKHNVQYLLGGYRFFFFEAMDAIALSRYVPALIYQKGRPENAAYVGCGLESYERELGRFWPSAVYFSAVGSKKTMQQVSDHVRRLGDSVRSVGLELSHIPADWASALQGALSSHAFKDATFPLERLRVRKTAEEAALLREASTRVVAAMDSVFKSIRPGQSKEEVVERLRREEVNRGLVFDYCLITAGTSLNRAPSNQVLRAGDILSLDSGANYKGYIGDLCRMGIVGEPDSELQDLLALVLEVQDKARVPIAPGNRGGDIAAHAESILKSSEHRAYTQFEAHGMGLVSHEAPRLMDFDTALLSYAGYDRERRLESGMVLSLETTMKHPKRGLIKIEDTVLVTGAGHEGLGDAGRAWNCAGTQ